MASVTLSEKSAAEALADALTDEITVELDTNMPFSKMVDMLNVSGIPAYLNGWRHIAVTRGGIRISGVNKRITKDGVLVWKTRFVWIPPRQL